MTHSTVYDGDMDEECIGLCDVINSMSGLRTIDSCCGHGKREFSIWFIVDDPGQLPALLYYCDACHSGFNWICTVHTDCARSPVVYHLRSESKGEKAYKEARWLTATLARYLIEGD